MQQQDLLLDERDGTEHDVLARLRDVREVLERREAVSRLPDQVRGEDHERHDAAEPEPRLREARGAAASEQHADRDRDAEEERRVLVHRGRGPGCAEPSHSRESPVRRCGRAREAAHPEQRLDDVHRHQARPARKIGASRTASPASSCAKRRRRAPGEQRREHDDQGRSGHRGRSRRAANNEPPRPEREPRVHGDQRRVVHVAPVEVATAVEEVELVAEVAVAADAGEEVQHQLRRAQRDEPDLRHRRQRGRVSRRFGPAGSSAQGAIWSEQYPVRSRPASQCTFGLPPQRQRRSPVRLVGPRLLIRPR